MGSVRGEERQNRKVSQDEREHIVILVWEHCTVTNMLYTVAETVGSYILSQHHVLYCHLFNGNIFDLP